MDPCPAGGVVLLQGQNAFDDMETADADERIRATSCDAPLESPIRQTAGGTVG